LPLTQEEAMLRDLEETPALRPGKPVCAPSRRLGGLFPLLAGVGNSVPIFTSCCNPTLLTVMLADTSILDF
jgi:hypothetical protein